MVQVQSNKAFDMPEDRFGLFQGRDINAKKVVRFFKYKKREVSQASGIKLHSIRYDDKMPIELEERLREWATAINLVADFFKDEQKTMLWFVTPNSFLGEYTPRDIIRIGRYTKLMRFIRNALSENKSQ